MHNVQQELIVALTLLRIKRLVHDLESTSSQNLVRLQNQAG